MTDQKPTLLQQAVRQTPWRAQSQTTAIIALVVVVTIIIGALYLAQATTTATTGRELEDLESTRDFLQRANEETSAEIASKRNISDVRGRAQNLGFVPVSSDRLEYIVVDGYSPIRATPTPEMTAEPTYVYDETFNGWVQKQWDNLVKQFEAWTGRDKATGTPRPQER
jgi:hypothetical protein